MRVLLVGDDPLARSGLATLLAGRELEVVGQLAGGKAALLRSYVADVIAWDLGPAGAADALERLADVEGAPVLALIAHEAQAPLALAAGARGAVLRDARPDRLEAALRAVAAGLVVLDEAAAETALRPRPVESPLADALTPREREVLQLLSQGLSNKLIAARLGISEHTAKFHVNAIFGKLSATTRTEAVARAARLGLVVL